MRARLIIVLATCFAQSVALASGERDIERWMTNEALPYLQQQLTEHPRFTGETLMFVVLDDNLPATVSSSLALDLRDKMLAAAVATPGVKTTWRQSGTDNSHSGNANDCERDQTHYYIGIELAQEFDGRYRASLRALDLEERNWVNGFGKSWVGNLNTAQRRAAKRRDSDLTFLGARDVPFAEDQADLLARHLAHELTCSLHRETNGEYIIPASFQAADTLGLDNTVELVSNNVAANDAIELTNDDAAANADISGKAHQIDASLFQYWLTVTPRDEESELSSLTVSAYLRRPAIPFAHNERVAPARTLVAMPTSQRGTLIGQHRFADNAVVFFVQHQPHFGLVRLDNGVCRKRTMANVVREGDPLQFPVRYSHTHNSETIAVDTWFAEPLRDTYYAIAVSNERTARQVANQLDRLPIRCGAATRQGLTGPALHRWLEEFSQLATQAERHIDWRAIAVRDIL